MTYGVPYQGSKNRIAKELIAYLPEGERFVDLFAGGCAMTHAAIASGKYKSFLVNDKYPYGLRLFQMGVNGQLNDPKYLRWVSREEFEKEKDTDPFVKLCWSFSNNGKSYMYNKKLEPTKKALHYAVVFDDWTYIGHIGLSEAVVDALKKSVDGKNDWNERRLAMTHAAFDNKVIGLPHNMLQNLERLNISRVQNLERLDTRMEYTQKDYKDYEHREGDVVYCDPPYKGVWRYDGREFNNDEFYEWVRTREYPVYFSEYSAPEEGKNANVDVKTKRQKKAEIMKRMRAERKAHVREIGLEPKMAKCVMQINLTGDIVGIYPNVYTAEKEKGLSGILECIFGLRETVGNHKWDWVFG